MYLSPAEAISPAIRRTKAFLFHPFRFGTYFKLCLVALLTEGLGSNLRSHSGNMPSHGPTVYSPFSFRPEWIAPIVAVSLALLLLGCIIFYLITRLRFAWFHCLIHNIKQVTPGWRLYRTQAARFFWLNLVVGFCFLLLIILVAIPFAAGFWRLFRETHASGHFDLGAFLALFLPLIPIIILLALAGFATDLILRDFMLPQFALENATAGQAWAGAWARIRTEKGPFFVYALLRVVLPIIGVILLFAILIIPGIVFAACVAIAEVALHSAFDGAAAGIFLEVLVGLIAFVIALIVGICFGGPLSTAIREYALLFYGARYQPLGDILYPPPPPAPNTPATA